MRLIDADKLIDRFKELKGSDTLANMFVRDVIKEISKQPVVYDVDKVVERLEEINEDDNICEKFKDKDRRHCKNARGCFDCAIRESVEIIKSGGNIFDNPELLKGDTNGKTDSM